MARPRGSKNKDKTPPSPPVDGDSNGVGHNGAPELDPDRIRQALALQHMKLYEAALAEKKAAAADFLAVTRQIKAELGKNGVKLIKDMILVSTPEGEEELRERAERARQAARYMAAELGHQFSFLDKGEVLSSTDRAYEEGRRDGANEAPMAPDYPPGSEEFQQYATGWHEGTAALKTVRNGPVLAETEEEREILGDIERNGIGPTVAAA